MHHRKAITIIVIAALLPSALPALADDTGVTLDYSAGITFNAGDSQLAPYYIMAGRGGTVTQRYSALLNASLSHEIDTTKRLSWGSGVELWGGYTNSADYKRWNAELQEFRANSQHPARLWVQQLYGSVKWRGVLTHVGIKRPDSPVVDPLLSSGDLTMSGNALPGVGIETGFVNYQTVPFTHGWVQVEGRVGYYRLQGDDWLTNHFSQYNSFVTTDYWFNYKRMHLRTNPGQPVVFTFGLQAACQFGGKCETYYQGQLQSTVTQPADAKAFFRTLVPGSGGGDGGQYVEGNHLGTWDVMLDWKLPNGKGMLRGYYESPWEDGSGIGKLNGFDGLWGLEYRNTGEPSIVDGAVIEYVDLTNQSGYVHWSADDYPDSPISQANGGKGCTGADDYYNNYFYNSYQNMGQSIGSPFVKSLIYNQDGYMRYTDNLMRGFHMGVRGTVSRELTYRALLSYRRSWGTPFEPRAHGASCTSWMLEAVMHPKWMPELAFGAQVAMDRGQLLGNNFGGLVSISYSGNFTIKK